VLRDKDLALKLTDAAHKKYWTGLAHKSHLGEYQFFHSMTGAPVVEYVSKKLNTPKAFITQADIVGMMREQAVDWMELGIAPLQKGDTAPVLANTDQVGYHFSFSLIRCSAANGSFCHVGCQIQVCFFFNFVTCMIRPLFLIFLFEQGMPTYFLELHFVVSFVVCSAEEDVLGDGR
jgi:hypothetical protein